MRKKGDQWILEKKTLGRKVRKIRRLKDVTQEQIAKALGYTKGQVSAWESGRSEIGSTNLLKLVDILGCDLVLELFRENLKEENLETVCDSI